VEVDDLVGDDDLTVGPELGEAAGWARKFAPNDRNSVRTAALMKNRGSLVFMLYSIFLFYSPCLIKQFLGLFVEFFELVASWLVSGSGGLGGKSGRPLKE
jgi:hypothetical protein